MWFWLQSSLRLIPCGAMKCQWCHGVIFTCSKGNLYINIPAPATGCEGGGGDIMSQASPGETALSVKGNSLMEGIVVSCQQPALPVLGEGCPSWAKEKRTGHQQHLLNHLLNLETQRCPDLSHTDSLVESNSLFIYSKPSTTKPAAA